jgi:hypothetical protein
MFSQYCLEHAEPHEKEQRRLDRVARWARANPAAVEALIAEEAEKCGKVHGINSVNGNVLNEYQKAGLQPMAQMGNQYANNWPGGLFGV